MQISVLDTESSLYSGIKKLYLTYFRIGIKHHVFHILENNRHNSSLDLTYILIYNVVFASKRLPLRPSTSRVGGKDGIGSNMIL